MYTKFKISNHVSKKLGTYRCTAPPPLGVSIADCGAACARRAECEGFTSNKMTGECQLVETSQIDDTTMFPTMTGTNLYLNTTVECLTSNECAGDRVMGCHQGRCVHKCKPFQMVTDTGTCKTTWKFVHSPWASASIFLPWLFVNASYIHGFHFDPDCLPEDRCSLLVTGETIPNWLYEVWPLQGDDWPVKEGIVFRLPSSGSLKILWIKNSKIHSVNELAYTGSFELSFDMIGNTNKLKVLIGNTEHIINLKLNFETLWLTAFHNTPSKGRWFSIEDPEMTDLVGFANCLGHCTPDFTWDMYRAMKNTVIENPLEPDHMIQWYQLSNDRSWVSKDPETEFNKITEPTKYDVHSEGFTVFELKLEEGEEVVIHGGERSHLSSFLSTDYKTDFTSIESALKIGYASSYPRILENFLLGFLMMQGKSLSGRILKMP